MKTLQSTDIVTLLIDAGLDCKRHQHKSDSTTCAYCSPIYQYQYQSMWMDTGDADKDQAYIDRTFYGADK